MMTFLLSNFADMCENKETIKELMSKQIENIN